MTRNDEKCINEPLYCPFDFSHFANDLIKLETKWKLLRKIIPSRPPPSDARSFLCPGPWRRCRATSHNFKESPERNVSHSSMTFLICNWRVLCITKCTVIVIAAVLFAAHSFIIIAARDERDKRTCRRCP